MKTPKACWNIRSCHDKSSRRKASVLIFILLVSLLTPTSFLAQDVCLQEKATPATTFSEEIFRLERVPVDGGAELITIQARLDGIQTPEGSNWIEDYVDVFRKSTPEGGHYTWWSYRPGVREKNVGWRIDYHFVSAGFEKKIKRAFHLPQVKGSDHCPVGLEINK